MTCFDCEEKKFLLRKIRSALVVTSANKSLLDEVDDALGYSHDPIERLSDGFRMLERLSAQRQIVHSLEGARCSASCLGCVVDDFLEFHHSQEKGIDSAL